MRAAISTDGSMVSAHFGRCPVFTIVDIENGEIKEQSQISNPGHAPGAIPQFLQSKGVEVIVCGGMGHKAMSMFSSFDVKTVLGVEGTVEEAIRMLKDGRLEGGESLCSPGAGKGYGLDKNACDHED